MEATSHAEEPSHAPAPSGRNRVNFATTRVEDGRFYNDKRTAINAVIQRNEADRTPVHVAGVAVELNQAKDYSLYHTARIPPHSPVITTPDRHLNSEAEPVTCERGGNVVVTVKQATAVNDRACRSPCCVESDDLVIGEKDGLEMSLDLSDCNIEVCAVASSSGWRCE